MNKKLISFCLWGDNPKYTIGAVRNAILAKTIYPDWICRYYIGKSVPENIVTELENFDNTLARPATIPRARAAETERKAISYH